jgi:hypothetical protein
MVFKSADHARRVSRKGPKPGARVYKRQVDTGIPKSLRKRSNMSESQYFEHVAEYSVAVCRECRYAVWPNQIKGHLQEQHNISRKVAEAVGQRVRSWAGLTLYPSELEIPSGIPKSVQQLPVYTDGLLCQLDLGRCSYITRSKECMRKHWQRQHQWSAGKKRGRPSQIKEKGLRARIEQGSSLVHCQRLRYMPMAIEGSVEVVANQQRRSTAPLPSASPHQNPELLPRLASYRTRYLLFCVASITHYSVHLHLTINQ